MRPPVKEPQPGPRLDSCLPALSSGAVLSLGPPSPKLQKQGSISQGNLHHRMLTISPPYLGALPHLLDMVSFIRALRCQQSCPHLTGRDRGSCSVRAYT